MPYSTGGGGTITVPTNFSGQTEFTGQTNISGPDSTTNVEIGSVANDANGGTGGTSVVVGNGASNSNNSTGAVIIGSLAVTGGAATDGIGIGRAANIQGVSAIAIGQGAVAGANDIVLGAGATSAGANQFVAGSTASPVASVFFGKGVTSTTAAVCSINATGGSGADNAGGGLTLAGGRGTGTAAGGDVRLQSTVSIGTGAVAQTLGDRDFLRAQAKALTESAATSFVRVTTAAGEATGGQIDYTIIASDGTDHQSRSGSVYFAGVNKATVVTAPAPTEIGTSLAAVSAGTLTVTWTAATAANTFDLQANAVSSLTQTTLSIFYRVRMNGPGTITAL